MRNSVRKTVLTLCLVLVLVMTVPVLSFAAGRNTDTLADWDLKVTVPDGATAVLKGDEYYIYTMKAGSIPYVMIRPYAYDDAKEFLADFTDYMKKQYQDLKIVSDIEKTVIDGRVCYETDYSYQISGYTALDRRIATTVGELTYMFCAKEVSALNMTVGDTLEKVIADCEFLAEETIVESSGNVEEGLSKYYLYCEDSGMAKYYLDFSNELARNLVLHCFFRSGEPTYYEAMFILDLSTAEIENNRILIHKVYNEKGIEVSEWFRSLALAFYNDGTVTMQVERDEHTLAGGPEDNILTGDYEMTPRSSLSALGKGPYTEKALISWASENAAAK